MFCRIWKPKHCRKTRSPFLLKRKTEKNDGVGSSHWSEVLFSILLCKPNQCSIPTHDHGPAPHLIDGHAIGLSPGRAWLLSFSYEDLPLCREALFSVLAFSICSSWRNCACVSYLKSPENTTERPKLLNICSIYIPK